MYNLLTVRGDAKTVKGEPLGFLSGILYLQPASLSGKNLCPGSSAGCRASCLYTAGRPRIFPKIYKARERKTKLFLEDQKSFMLQLMRDISKLECEAKNKGMKPVVRANGTSDIDWMKIKVGGKNIFEHFPKVQFLDYTKISRRMFEKRPKNYHLTFSLSESNVEIAKTVAAAGYNVAVVFKKRPTTFWNKETIDGDQNDLRFLDKKGVIVGLKAKGKALKDTTGFVQNQ